MATYRVFYTRTIEYNGLEDIEAESAEQARQIFNERGGDQPENWSDGNDVGLSVNSVAIRYERIDGSEYWANAAD